MRRKSSPKAMTILDEEPSESLRFTLRIDNFSSVAEGRGVLTSHVFRSSESGSGWSLVVQADGADATVFRLHRRGYRRRRQSVGVRLTVVDCIGSRLLSAKRQIHFRGLNEETYPVMRLKGDQLVGWRGLRTLCFLPNDTLTLRCEITESEELDPLNTQAFDRGVGSCANWRDSFILSIPATGMALA